MIWTGFQSASERDAFRDQMMQMFSLIAPGETTGIKIIFTSELDLAEASARGTCGGFALEDGMLLNDLKVVELRREGLLLLQAYALHELSHLLEPDSLRLRSLAAATNSPAKSVTKEEVAAVISIPRESRSFTYEIETHPSAFWRALAHVHFRAFRHGLKIIPVQLVGGPRNYACNFSMSQLCETLDEEADALVSTTFTEIHKITPPTEFLNLFRASTSLAAVDSTKGLI